MVGRAVHGPSRTLVGTRTTVVLMVLGLELSTAEQRAPPLSGRIPVDACRSQLHQSFPYDPAFGVSDTDTVLALTLDGVTWPPSESEMGKLEATSGGSACEAGHEEPSEAILWMSKVGSLM